jgi:methylated-DNA-[protein]-cysteine S-methyltransferase
MDYQAILAAPFGKLGIRCTDEALLGIEFLPANARTVVPCNALATKACAQLETYFVNPYFHFFLPLKLAASLHHRKVWQAMQDIPCRHTLTYGEIAAQIGSSARAVGQACGNNPIPIVIPCHRVVSKTGLGGFMKHAEGESLNIKRWLLTHEANTPSPRVGEGSFDE